MMTNNHNHNHNHNHYLNFNLTHTITIRLFATLRTGRGKTVSLPLTPGVTTPQDLIEQLGILREEVAILLVNGRDGLWQQALAEGDYLSIFPPVGGG